MQRMRQVYEMVYRMHGDQIVINDIRGIQSSYDQLFNSVILRLNNRLDNKLEKYLLNKAIDNPTLDQSRFS